MSTPARRRFAIELRDEGAADDTPAIIRLRHFLKNALRAWGLRCIRAVELHDAGPGEADAGAVAGTGPASQEDGAT